ncbi:tetratricopeptide repeat protein [Algoriphagus sediminis]|uniref:Tetratricopeptide repeat protein n=1 Tax=Algoriphagus sediminis TaxID=3057113 RepID=A0ABT7YG65_9BACT|nr:tetratricopeptide repeat protein [Algoriphagus sediminis]MDN3205516.1 tetratricopeptide repeat protein [Algoriphagus sediminis]
MKGINTSNKNNSRYFKNVGFLILVVISLATLIFAYSNHFSNSFHFDDSHTIENNSAIHEINLKLFFTDATTFSSLPSNQSYRPLTTLENAIDYKLGDGLDTKVFHIHIFLTFLITCFLIGLFIKKLLDRINYSEDNKYWALLCATIFGFLCANAETVNYIIQRAEITAALFLLAGFVVFLSGGIWRKYYIYLLFPLIGFFAKEMAFVFAPLLLLYSLIFEEQVDLLHFYRKEEFKKTLKSFYKALPAFILTIIFYLLYTKMRPMTFNPGGLSTLNYLITQPMVMVHYIATYFIPYNLSADTDWVVYTSILDYRAILGIVIITLLVYVALRASNKKETHLISFGFLWFFISLLPTSSFIPFAEVLNDHRTFIPYIGLTISFVFGVNYILKKYLYSTLKNQKVKTIIFLVMIIFLAANVYGVRQRNKVWNNSLSLWKDVTIKSPNNGRGLMNYGLALMAKGEYAEAESYYKKALLLNPNYATLHINLGILTNAMGDKIEAEDYFKRALELNPSSHSGLYYYAKYLNENNRFEEAKKLLSEALKISPTYTHAQVLLLNLHHKAEEWDKLKNLAESILNRSPNNRIARDYLNVAQNKKSISMILEEEALMEPSAEKYLNLSLHYFRSNKFEKTISAARLALSLKKNYPEAYNNIGIAHFRLGEYDKAIEAYTKALNLKSDFELAKNNLSDAINAAEIQNRDSNPKNSSADDFLDLSLTFYNNGDFLSCIKAAQRSNEISPSSAAFNNICAAYNQLKKYDKAIEACNQALKLDTSNKLARGNLNFANSKKIN